MNGLHHLLAKYELIQLNPLVDDYLSAQVAAWPIAEIEPELSKRQQAIDELKGQIDRAREAAEEIRRQADSLQTRLKGGRSKLKVIMKWPCNTKRCLRTPN